MSLGLSEWMDRYVVQSLGFGLDQLRYLLLFLFQFFREFLALLAFSLKDVLHLGDGSLTSKTAYLSHLQPFSQHFDQLVFSFGYCPLDCLHVIFLFHEYNNFKLILRIDPKGSYHL